MDYTVRSVLKSGRPEQLMTALFGTKIALDGVMPCRDVRDVYAEAVNAHFVGEYRTLEEFARSQSQVKPKGVNWTRCGVELLKMGYFNKGNNYFLMKTETE